MATVLELDHAARVEAHQKRIQSELEAQRVKSVELRQFAKEFVSAPDAREMSYRDINNVEDLTTDEMQSLLKQLQQSSPTMYAKLVDAECSLWGGWDDDDARWELTPHQLRRSRERHSRSL